VLVGTSRNSSRIFGRNLKETRWNVALCVVEQCETQACRGIIPHILNVGTATRSGHFTLWRNFPFRRGLDRRQARPGLLVTRITKPRFLDISAHSLVTIGWDIPTMERRNNRIKGRITLELKRKRVWRCEQDSSPAADQWGLVYEQEGGRLLYLLRD
jgi:hypothetical protein